MWEYIGQALEICAPSADIWVHIVRGWLLCKFTGSHEESPRTTSANRSAARWKRRHKRGIWIKINDRIKGALAAAIVYLDNAATLLIGCEPTEKEKTTWTRPRFAAQNRVRSDKSTGQGYNKQRIGTSAWFRTAATVCLIASTAGKAQARGFDSNSVVIHVDDCATRCITNSISDFIRPLQKVIGRVKGMGGDKIAVTAVGTIRWRVDDEDGTSHSFLILGSLYIPESPARLFSPQHWAQESKDDVPKKNGTWQATFADHVMIVWGQQRFRKIIPFDKSNVAPFSTTPGCKEFRVFRACLEEGQGRNDEREEGLQDVVAFDATLIVDDEEDGNVDQENDEKDDESIVPV